MKPCISLVLGDPSGIGPELVAKVLSDPSTARAADVHLVASRDEWLKAQRIAGVEVPFAEAASIEEADFGSGLPVLQHVDVGGRFVPGEVSEVAGRHVLRTLGIALDAVAAGATDALCFAPLNKAAMHAGGNSFGDELHWFAERLGVEGYVGEINVLDRLWTSRVTSHVALRDVSDLISPGRIVEAVLIIDRVMREAGFEEPRIAVCGLNPHAGEGGVFGREELDVIAPAVAEARRSARVDGPFPADTIFLRARDGHYDAIVSMYHDQGQIALKLLGFDRGVSVHAGLPVPVTTPAHGTAHDIVGQNVASPTAMRRALGLACELASRRGPRDGRGAAAAS